MAERWKDIKGYKKLYQVSNTGKIKSFKKKIKTRSGRNIIKQKILKSSLNSEGYLTVKLYKNNTGKTFKIHKLVAKAFISNPQNLPCVEHTKKGKLYNRVGGLEWVTYSENTKRAYKRGEIAHSKNRITKKK